MLKLTSDSLFQDYYEDNFTLSKGSESKVDKVGEKRMLETETGVKTKTI